jgi:hypothetical protein
MGNRHLIIRRVPTQSEFNDWIDSEHDSDAAQRCIEAAIGYLKRGEPVPDLLVPMIVSRLRGERTRAGAPPKAAWMRVGAMIARLINEKNLGKTEARARAAKEFHISKSTAVNYHNSYLNFKSAFSEEDWQTFWKTKP